LTDNDVQIGVAYFMGARFDLAAKQIKIGNLAAPSKDALPSQMEGHGEL